MKKTQMESVLAAAASFKGEFRSPDLVVRAHEMDRATFCLEGYPHLPDSNKVLAHLMGERGLRAKGLVRRVDQKVYVTTPAGRAAVLGEAVAPPPPPPPPTKGLHLAGCHMDELARVLATRAWSERHDPGRIGIGDAIDFWCPAGTRLTAGKVETMQAFCETIRRALEPEAGASGYVVMPDGRVFTDADAKELVALGGELAKRYRSQIRFMTIRSGRTADV